MRNHKRIMRNYQMLYEIMKKHLEEAEELKRLIDKHRDDMFGGVVKWVEKDSERKISYYERYIKLLK